MLPPLSLQVLGYFMRAKIIFADDKDAAAVEVKSYMTRHVDHLVSSPWRGLPEICNENGSFAPDGCPTQAWSAGNLLDALYEIGI